MTRLFSTLSALFAAAALLLLAAPVAGQTFDKLGPGLRGVFDGSSSIGDVNNDENLTEHVEADDGNGGSATRSFAVETTSFFGLDAGIRSDLEDISTTMGDVDGDGNLDLFLTGNAGNTRDQDAKTILYLGDGQGEFTEAEADLGGVFSGSASVADVNNDGNLDFLKTGVPFQNGETTVLRLGDGEGGFSLARADLVDVRSSSTSIADVNGDGNQDILVTGDTDFEDPMTTLYLGDGEGGFTEANAELIDVMYSSTSIGDFNNDGNPDLVITGVDENFDPTTTLYLGDGEGGFSEAEADLIGAGNESTSIADVNRDGNQDLLINTTLYLGDGNGGLSEANAGLGSFRNISTSIADVNGDGNPDLLIVGEDDSETETATLYLGDGQSNFTEANAGLAGVSGGFGEPASLIRDLDNDGHPDLLVGGNGSLTLYENLSSESLLAATSTKTVNSSGSVDFGETGLAIDFANVNGSGDVTVRKFSNGPIGSDGIAELNVSSYRFVLSAGGDLTFDESTEVRLDVSSVGGVGEASTVTVYKRSTQGSGLFSALSTSYDSGSDELVVTTGSFGEFVLASNSSDNPLPVELAGFDARVDDEAVQLSWQTASETGNAGFRIQRRTGEGAKGREGAWTTVGHVEGAGTTPEAQSYRFTDADLPFEAQTLTYRLVQIDRDGTRTVAGQTAVEVGAPEQFALHGAFPNPVRSGQTTIRYELPEERAVTVGVYDALGRKVRTLVGDEPQQGRQELTFRAKGLSSGVYFYRITAGDYTETRKLVLVR